MCKIPYTFSYCLNHLFEVGSFSHFYRRVWKRQGDLHKGTVEQPAQSPLTVVRPILEPHVFPTTAFLGGMTAFLRSNFPYSLPIWSVFSIFRVVQPLVTTVFEYFHHPQRKPIPVSPHSLFLTTPPPIQPRNTNILCVCICLFGTFHINGILTIFLRPRIDFLLSPTEFIANQ